VGVIPARYGSTRFHAKALKVLSGKTIIERVWRQAKKAKLLDDVFVATDDQRIADVVAGFGGKYIMTSTECETGSDRVCECLRTLDAKFQVIVNIQGDEPMVEPEHIDALAALLHNDSRADMGCLITPIRTEDELKNVNICKIVIDRHGYALYFSRSVIPHPRAKVNVADLQFLRALGLYSYTRSFLAQWPQLPPSWLARTESLEQLRVLEAGFKIKTSRVSAAFHGVDTAEDLEDLEREMQKPENREHFN